MIPFTTILTHPGGAHKDEFLACCVLLSLHPVPIVRRGDEKWGQSLGFGVH